MGSLSRPDPFWRIRTESGMPCYHSVTPKSNLCGSDFNLGQAHKHLTKYIYIEGIQPFSNDLQNTCSEFKFFLQNINIEKKTWNECTCQSILRNFLLYDSTLLDLGSAFDHYLSLGTCALVKQYAKHFHA